MIDLSFLKETPGDIILQNSGGPDCSILMWATAKYVSENNLDIKFYHITVDTEEKFFYSKYAKIVMEYISSKFNITVKEHRVKQIPHTLEYAADGRNWKMIGYRETQRDLCIELYKENKNIRYIFSGVSNMLPAEDTFNILRKKRNRPLSNYSIDEDRRGRDEKPIFKKFPLIDYSIDEDRRDYREVVAFTPFINMNKYDIARYYEEYSIEEDLIEELLPLTRSCEASSKDTDRYLGETHCGKCLFCVERELAFCKLV